MPVNLLAALHFAYGHGIEDEDFSLNGITEMTGVDGATSALLQNLPESLRTLTFAPDFHQELHNVRLPPGLQKSDFWERVQSEPRQCDVASRPSKPEIWLVFQSATGPT